MCKHHPAGCMCKHPPGPPGPLRGGAPQLTKAKLAEKNARTRYGSTRSCGVRKQPGGEFNSPVVKCLKGLVTGDFHLRHFFGVAEYFEGEWIFLVVEELLAKQGLNKG
eukprot:1283268-Pyramimonas_sp.AAC.1